MKQDKSVVTAIAELTRAVWALQGTAADLLDYGKYAQCYLEKRDDHVLQLLKKVLRDNQLITESNGHHQEG